MKHHLLSIVFLSSALFFIGCTEQPQPQPVKVVKKDINKTYTAMPAAPKKNIELKEVEDENFSSDYMYPETKKQSVKKETAAHTAVASETSGVTAMTNAECISMIGQEKFDKYAQMFGGASGALKKCTMLKAL